MISKQAIGSAGDAARYHNKSFNQEATNQRSDNYYVNEQATARWQGKGAELLGKRGRGVSQEDFVALLSGKLTDPKTGQSVDLSDNSKGDQRRPGVDFTVAPPKSVSIMALVGKDERIVAAHLAANERVMNWFEKHAAVIRVKDENGRNRIERTGNLLYATVLHETNRHNEPQLHSHNVIVNATYDEQRGRWRSLTNDRLFELRSRGDIVYKAELAHSLKQLGYEIEYAQNGVDFEIKGVSREQIEAFSTRRMEIQDALKARGIEPGEASFDARQTAALATREGKQEFPREVLQSAWDDAAKKEGLELDTLAAAAKHRAALKAGIEKALASPAGASREALTAVSWAVRHLSEREQSFKLEELELNALKFSRGGMADVENAIAEHLRNHDLLDKGTSDEGAMMFTTPRAVDSEMRFVRNIQQGKGQGNVVLDKEAEFQTFLKAFEVRKTAEIGEPFKLSAEQVNAARNVLMHADSYQGIQGAAGTGKTAALEMVQEVAKAKGWEVIGMATSSTAARELERASGITSDTVAGYFVQRENRLKAAELRVDELRGSINATTRLRHSPQARIESHRLFVKGDGVFYGKHRYTFDHQRGDVFRSPDNMRAAVGMWLTNLANSSRDRAVSTREAATTFGERARSTALVKGVEVAQSLGRRWMTFEQVGTAEAVAARNTLQLVRGKVDDQLRHDFEKAQAQLANLKRFGNAEGRKTLIVMDESSLTGIGDTEKLSTLSREIGARVVLQGDTNQHGSVPAGRAFDQAQQAAINLSVLEETRRFDKATAQTKAALQEMKAGRYGAAIDALDKREVREEELAPETAKRYLANYEELKAKGQEDIRIGIVAVTNNDRKAINAEVHKLLGEKGIISRQSFTKTVIDDPKLTEAEQIHSAQLSAAKVNVLVYRKTYREIGVKSGDVVKVTGFDFDRNRVYGVNAEGRKIEINPKRQDYFSPGKEETRQFSVGDLVEARAIIAFEDKSIRRIDNGTRGVIVGIDGNGALVRWNRREDDTLLTDGQLRFVDHAYAHTSYKEQGQTNDREIWAVSRTGAKFMDRLAAYVAASRARGNTEIITSDLETLRRNAGAEAVKTTAVDDLKKKAGRIQPAAGERDPAREQARAEDRQTKRQITPDGQKQAKDVAKAREASKVPNGEQAKVRELAQGERQTARADQQQKPEKTRDKGWLREL